MKAIILAAGHGMRLRPQTLKVPKALIKIAGHTLIEDKITSLRGAGFTSIIINVHHLKEQIMKKLGDGSRYGIHIAYSVEEKLLDTAGGIVRALPFFEGQPFAMISCDTYSDFDFSNLAQRLCEWKEHGKSVNNEDHNLAHLVMVENVEGSPGDFVLDEESGQLCSIDKADSDMTGQDHIKNGTFAGMAIFRTRMFSDYERNKTLALKPVLAAAMSHQQVSGQWHDGKFFDCGSQTTLEQARKWSQGWWK